MSHLSLDILEGRKLMIVLSLDWLEIVLECLLWVDQHLSNVMVCHLECFFLSLNAVQLELHAR